MAAPAIIGPLDPTTGQNLGYAAAVPPLPPTAGMCDLEMAILRRSQLLQLLAVAPTMPSVVTEGGRTVDFIAYRRSLTDEIDSLNKSIPLLAGPMQFRQRLGRG